MMSEGGQTIVLLVASMSGTAEMVADELAQEIKSRGLTARIIGMEKAKLSLFAEFQTFIVCSSTYGTGDVPDNGQAFYAELTEQRPDLSQIRYGLVGLGDMTYFTSFCGGGRKFDEIFSSLGARRIGDCLFHDAKSDVFADQAALEWLEGWLTELLQVEGR
jgi:MioC protein